MKRFPFGAFMALETIGPIGIIVIIFAIMHFGGCS
jgi:hypothetical protein